jgi:diphthamide synthase (EF-2-diphthine--ammonia ligase)
MTVQEEFNQFTGGIRLNENKIRYDLCPAIAQREYAKVWTQGLEKYPARNWEKGFPFSVVIASAMRHLEAMRLGEMIDKESGLLHSAHLMANASMLTEFYFTHPELNDLQKQIK